MFIGSRSPTISTQMKLSKHTRIVQVAKKFAAVGNIRHKQYDSGKKELKIAIVTNFESRHPTSPNIVYHNRT